MQSNKGVVLTGVGVIFATFLFLTLLSGRSLLFAEETTTTTTTTTTTASEPIREVKTIQWFAKVNKKLAVTDIVTGETLRLKKKAKVIVVDRYYAPASGKQNGNSLCALGDHQFYISNKFLTFKKDLCTADTEGDYNTATKENFVNKVRSLLSRTNRLIWICLDKQRVNVFTGSLDNWTLEKTFLCCTGNAKKPTRVTVDTVDFKKEKYRIEGASAKYFVEVIGSGFHMWKLKGKFRRFLGKHTISHGCIRLQEMDAKWIFDNIEPGTKVLIY